MPAGFGAFLLTHPREERFAPMSTPPPSPRFLWLSERIVDSTSSSFPLSPSDRASAAGRCAATLRTPPPIRPARPCTTQAGRILVLVDRLSGTRKYTCLGSTHARAAHLGPVARRRRALHAGRVQSRLLRQEQRAAPRTRPVPVRGYRARRPMLAKSWARGRQLARKRTRCLRGGLQSGASLARGTQGRPALCAWRRGATGGSSEANRWHG